MKNNDLILIGYRVSNISLISHFFVANNSLGSMEKKFVKFYPVAFVLYEICGFFMSKIPLKNIRKLFFFKFFAHEK